MFQFMDGTTAKVVAFIATLALFAVLYLCRHKRVRFSRQYATIPHDFENQLSRVQNSLDPKVVSTRNWQCPCCGAPYEAGFGITREYICGGWKWNSTINHELTHQAIGWYPPAEFVKMITTQAAMLNLSKERKPPRR